MTTVVITGNTTDGRLRKTSNVDYATCLAATPTVDTTATTIGIHHSKVGADYYADRGYLSFDISPYLSETITEAVLTVNISTTYIGTGELVGVYYNDWGASLTSTDWGALALPASSSLDFSTTGIKNISLINLSNLIGSNGRFEIVNLSESVTPTIQRNFDLDSANNATPANRPTLTLTYGTAIPAILYTRRDL